MQRLHEVKAEARAKRQPGDIRAVVQPKRSRRYHNKNPQYQSYKNQEALLHRNN
jgi:hypothetical protein